MSVLIRGMEMPKSCGDCRFCGGIADTDCGPCAWCDVDGKARVADTRQDCPLVPVPPHGRCIDADALVDKHFGKEFLSRVMTADEDDLGTALVNVPLVINNAPTIIQAEEGET